MLATGLIIDGRYQVTGLIGQGGMSAVYHAQDILTGKPLAIKESLRQGKVDNRTAELSLGAEGKLLKSLSNVHLPKIYDVVETRDNIMIVMDYVEGQSLDKVLEKSGAIPAEKVIEWSIQVCAVLHYLHTQNPPIIYRDMKPANLILRPDGLIMLIDFGTARTWKVDPGRTSDTMLIGTEGFAAPEQFGGQGQSDARTDIFCLGATIFNLVTNHSPYLKPYGITPLGKWDPALEDCALDKIIQKCTAMNPYERYQTAWDLREALIDAYNNPMGKTGLLGLLGGVKKQVPNWEDPLKKDAEAKGNRPPREQTGREAEQKTPAETPSGGGRTFGFDKRKEKSAMEKTQGLERQQQLAQTRESVHRAVTAQEEAAGGTSLWLIMLIVCLVGGVALSVLGIIAFMMLPTLGLVILVMAAAALAGGVFCTLKYVNE